MLLLNGPSLVFLGLRLEMAIDAQLSPWHQVIKALTALLTLASSRETTNSFTTSMRSLRVLGLTLLISALQVTDRLRSYRALSGLCVSRNDPVPDRF